MPGSSSVQRSPVWRPSAPTTSARPKHSAACGCSSNAASCAASLPSVQASSASHSATMSTSSLSASAPSRAPPPDRRSARVAAACSAPAWSGCSATGSGDASSTTTIALGAGSLGQQAVERLREIAGEAVHGNDDADHGRSVVGGLPDAAARARRSVRRAGPAATSSRVAARADRCMRQGRRMTRRSPRRVEVMRDRPRPARAGPQGAAAPGARRGGRQLTCSRRSR